MRLTQKSRSRIIAGLKRSWQDGGTHREKQKNNAKNCPDTARKRILFDARGREEFQVIKNNRKFIIICSIKGRADQFDIEEMIDFTRVYILTCSGPKILGEINKICFEGK
jgi:hypothetical protein